MADGRERVAPHAEAALRWLREAARPPPGVSLHASDGAVYTGVILVDRGRVVVMVAFRDERSREDRSPISFHENTSLGSASDGRHTRSLWERDHRDDGEDDDRWRR